MTSPTEHLFRNFSWSAWRKAHALRRSLLFLLIAFLAMRFGTFIPLPGVDSAAWAASFEYVRNLFY
ncbi:MAG: hypothetical protein JXQ99_07260 [Hyphomicrobiaceae bacterium]